MNIPVGISDFEEIRKNGYYYTTISISFLQIDGLDFVDAYQQLVYEIALLYR